MIILQHLVEDCKYTSWSDWTRCNGSCGENGTRTRQQSLIIRDPATVSPLCRRQIIDSMPCMNAPCECPKGVNCTCELTLWTAWSRCSQTCGGGQRVRLRQYRTNNTAHCMPENLREVQPCNVDCCPVNGQMTPWSEWSTCSKSCGTGVRKRFRSCTAPPPSCRGKPCSECTVETQVCNAQPCGKCIQLKWTSIQNSGDLEPECPAGQYYSPCANLCDTSCESLTCENQCEEPDRCVPGCVCVGDKVISSDGKCIDRKQCPCRVPTDNSTLVNGESNVRDPCKTYTCKDGCTIVTQKNCSACEWSPWTPFTDCSNACNGTQSRYRTYDGLNCPSKRTEEEKRPCSSNCTIVCYDTAPNGTIFSYKVGDLVRENRCNRSWVPCDNGSFCFIVWFSLLSFQDLSWYGLNWNSTDSRNTCWWSMESLVSLDWMQPSLQRNSFSTSFMFITRTRMWWRSLSEIASYQDRYCEDWWQ